MILLVIGSGGREHALIWKLAKSPHVTEMWCAPGNPGIALERLVSNDKLVKCVSIGAKDLQGLLAFAKEKRADLTVVGPDDPLALGIVDLFQANGLRIWGPNQKAAEFESSKAFSQAFMEKRNIPCAEGKSFEDPLEAMGYALRRFNWRCYAKDSDLALGKGAFPCENENEVYRNVVKILFPGGAPFPGKKVVIQEFLDGTEVSLHALCDGKTAKLFPTSQDHKRALDGDLGLNTGGMGTYSPTPFLSAEQLVETGRAILEPWLRGCAEEGIDYRGIIYPGVMLTPTGPKVLEFNARFGDPETQVYLTRLENDLVELLSASVDGTLDKHEMIWNPKTAACVVMASGGYPETYPKSKIITGIEAADALLDTKVFHAGTAINGEGHIITNGGRVLGITALGDSLQAALDQAYRGVDLIRFEGAKWRRDIGKKGLKFQSSK